MTKTIWIRLLIVVLAITASRKNFPVLGSSGAERSESSSRITRLSPVARYEGVIPSRRHHETRRVDWVKALACPHAIVRLEWSEAETLVPLPEQNSLSSLRQPRYLSAFLNSTAQESIPPPHSSSPGAGFHGCHESSERT